MILHNPKVPLELIFNLLYDLVKFSVIFIIKMVLILMDSLCLRRPFWVLISSKYRSSIFQHEKKILGNEWLSGIISLVSHISIWNAMFSYCCCVVLIVEMTTLYTCWTLPSPKLSTPFIGVLLWCSKSILSLMLLWNFSWTDDQDYVFCLDIHNRRVNFG